MYTGAMPVSEATYERVALEDIEGHWELVCGRLRRKPDMTMEHNSAAWRLAFILQTQLKLEDYEVRVNSARARLTSGAFIPDVVVIPASVMPPLAGTGRLEAYDDPLPFVAEVWSPSTGDYDVDEKLPEYRRRGDLEVWRIHPHERSVIAWRRQGDGSYAESSYSSGVVAVESLRGVRIDLAALFRGLPPAPAPEPD